MILYFDCFSGISGNMTIGAMLELGIDFEWLKAELQKLNLKDEFELIMNKTEKCGISGTYFNVKLPHCHEHCDHHHHSDEEHEHHCDQEHEHSHEHVNHHDHEHSHEAHEKCCGHHHDDQEHTHGHCHAHEHHHHKHRNLTDIHKIIDESTLNDNVKALSKKIFQFVADAESKIHNKSFDELHFHEVGAIDSIIDIVGTAICIDKLKPEKIYASDVAVGSGFVHCAHGMMPVPAPATADILKVANAPVYAGDVKSELTTPTGAAILAACVNEFCELPKATISGIGYGAGSKNFNTPNLLRVYSLTTANHDDKKKS